MRQLDAQNAFQLLTEGSSMQMGKGFFETLLVVDGKPIFLKEHIERLNGALRDFDIHQSLSYELVRDYIELRCNESSSNQSRSNQYYSKGVLKLSIYLGSNANFWHIQCTSDRYSQGIPWPMSLALSHYPQVKEHPLNPYKTMNYWSRAHDLQRAKSEMIDEVLYCDEHGQVLEGTKSNIFVLKDNVWFTPNAQSGILVGIARAWLIDCLKKQGEAVCEQAISADELQQAQMILLTNSIIGVTKATLVNGAQHSKAEDAHIPIEAWLKSLQLDYRGGVYGQI